MDSFRKNDNDSEFLEDIVEDEMIEDETEEDALDEETDTAAKQAANVAAAKAKGEKGSTATPKKKESAKYAGLYDDGMGGGAVVPEPVETDTSDSHTKQMKNLNAKRMAKEDIEVHMNAMFGGQDLSEDFKTKAATIFEAAVNEKVSMIEETLVEEHETRLSAAIEKIKEDMTQNLDSYLSYVVEQWMEENRLAVDNGLRTEVAENFIEGLRNLFLSHNIEVPQGKTDLLDEMTNKVEEVTESLNEQMQRNIDLNRKVSLLERDQVVAKLTEGMTHTDKERFRRLTENIVSDNSDEYMEKLEVIKESYFGNGEPITEALDMYTEINSTESDQETKKTEEPKQPLVENANMGTYAAMLSRMSRNRK
jgi:hypothetical protein